MTQPNGDGTDRQQPTIEELDTAIQELALIRSHLRAKQAAETAAAEAEARQRRKGFRLIKGGGLLAVLIWLGRHLPRRPIAIATTAAVVGAAAGAGVTAAVTGTGGDPHHVIAVPSGPAQPGPQPPAVRRRRPPSRTPAAPGPQPPPGTSQAGTPGTTVKPTPQPAPPASRAPASKPPQSGAPQTPPSSPPVTPPPGSPPPPRTVSCLVGVDLRPLLRLCLIGDG